MWPACGILSHDMVACTCREGWDVRGYIHSITWTKVTDLLSKNTQWRGFYAFEKKTLLAGLILIWHFNVLTFIAKLKWTSVL